MVQTEQQYICIHQCLMAVLEGNENNGPQREIHDNQGYEGKSWCSSLELTIPADIFNKKPLRSFRHLNLKALSLISV